MGLTGQIVRHRQVINLVANLADFAARRSMYMVAHHRGAAYRAQRQYQGKRPTNQASEFIAKAYHQDRISGPGCNSLTYSGFNGHRVDTLRRNSFPVSLLSTIRWSGNRVCLPWHPSTRTRYRVKPGIPAR